MFIIAGKSVSKIKMDRSNKPFCYKPNSYFQSGAAFLKKNKRAVDEGRMRIMKELIKSFIRDESAATAIEYGLIASLIAIAIIAGIRALGTNLSGTFAKVSGNLS